MSIVCFALWVTILQLTVDFKTGSYAVSGEKKRKIKSVGFLRQLAIIILHSDSMTKNLLHKDHDEQVCFWESGSVGDSYIFSYPEQLLSTCHWEKQEQEVSLVMR